MGQDAAKRAVAIALRNRWRRQLLGEELRAEVVPKNILMIGPTGCGINSASRVEAPSLHSKRVVSRNDGSGSPETRRAGKTEIARALSKLANAPFVKVEATKFTEVGFHGRDVDQIIAIWLSVDRVNKKTKGRGVSRRSGTSRPRRASWTP